MDQRMGETLGEGMIPAATVDWDAVTSQSADPEMDMDTHNLDPERTLGDLSEMEPRE